MYQEDNLSASFGENDKLIYIRKILTNSTQEGVGRLGKRHQYLRGARPCALLP